jgi:hypothetical protein
MARLTTDQRERLKDAEFAYIDKSGGRHLPIHDDEHVRNAIQRFSQTDFESRHAREEAARKILKAAKQHDIEVAEADDVRQAFR